VLAENLKQKRSLAQSGQRIVAIKKEKPETSQAAEPPALTGETRLVRFMEALAAGRTEQAGQELAALRQLWPAGTLGLVRAQAWYDLQTGRDAAAAHGYRTLLERLPGDEEAAINLASVLWRLHGPEEARGVLAEAARVNPESVGLQSALGRFTPGARH
jgi:predicted Zn-dependent protease